MLSHYYLLTSASTLGEVQSIIGHCGRALGHNVTLIIVSNSITKLRRLGGHPPASCIEWDVIPQDVMLAAGSGIKFDEQIHHGFIRSHKELVVAFEDTIKLRYINDPQGERIRACSEAVGRREVRGVFLDNAAHAVVGTMASLLAALPQVEAETVGPCKIPPNHFGPTG